LPEDKDGARRRLKEVIADYPATKAAAEAKEVLKRLKD
jgi:TolA-binding protein